MNQASYASHRKEELEGLDGQRERSVLHRGPSFLLAHLAPHFAQQ
jgi:hypothetical protein